LLKRNFRNQILIFLCLAFPLEQASEGTIGGKVKKDAKQQHCSGLMLYGLKEI
jgi:hypothetical protein